MAATVGAAALDGNKVRAVTARLSQSRRRADAAENRERILEAALAAFAADGLEVPMREIARRAAIAPATLYRHFATKRALAAEVFARQERACRAAIDTGLVDPDPWRGFTGMIERIYALHAENRRFTAAYQAAFMDDAEAAERRRPALRAVTELARRARATGRLRPDFTLDDLVLMLQAHRAVRSASPAAQAAASRRFAALTIDAFQATPGSPAPSAPGLEPRALRSA
jgi:AcrR family transcriptional regulator